MHGIDTITIGIVMGKKAIEAILLQSLWFFVRSSDVRWYRSSSPVRRTRNPFFWLGREVLGKAEIAICGYKFYARRMFDRSVIATRSRLWFPWHFQRKQHWDDYCRNGDGTNSKLKKPEVSVFVYAREDQKAKTFVKFVARTIQPNDEWQTFFQKYFQLCKQQRNLSIFKNRSNEPQRILHLFEAV